jgi:hypothetical protein
MERFLLATLHAPGARGFRRTMMMQDDFERADAAVSEQQDAAAEAARATDGDGGGERRDGESDSGDESEIEFEVLPESMREAYADLLTAMRNVVRTQPLAVIAAASGLAWLCGRMGARR